MNNLITRAYVWLKSRPGYLQIGLPFVSIYFAFIIIGIYVAATR